MVWLERQGGDGGADFALRSPRPAPDDAYLGARRRVARVSRRALSQLVAAACQLGESRRCLVSALRSPLAVSQEDLDFPFAAKDLLKGMCEGKLLIDHLLAEFPAPHRQHQGVMLNGGEGGLRARTAAWGPTSRLAASTTLSQADATSVMVRDGRPAHSRALSSSSFARLIRNWSTFSRITCSECSIQ